MLISIKTTGLCVGIDIAVWYCLRIDRGNPFNHHAQLKLKLISCPVRVASIVPPPTGMSYFLPHLPSGWHVDEAIKSEEDRVVVLRFGHDWDSQCMTMDETLYSVAEKVQNFAVIYLVDITQVPDFNKARHAFHQVP
jgi:thiol-disulfide isomerase/thioredoxin